MSDSPAVPDAGAVSEAPGVSDAGAASDAPAVSDAGARIIAAIRGWQPTLRAPLVVAIDGHGAAGKTTLAREVAAALEAVTVPMDSYFHEARATADSRPMAEYYDWRALRAEALEPAIERLREDAASHVDGADSPLIIVEGVSSASPALADLVARTVFVATPEPVRLQRLHRRVSDEEWDEHWLEAERRYFAIRPPESFDLIVSGATDAGYKP